MAVQQALNFYAALPSLPGLEVLEGTGIRNDFPRHIHRALIIGQVSAGSRTIHLAAGDVSIQASELFILNPGEAHRTTSDGHSYQVICIPAPLVEKISAQMRGAREKSPRFKETRHCHPASIKQFQQTLAIIKEPESLVHAESAIYELLATLMASLGTVAPARTEGPHGPAVARVCSYINQHYSEALPLDQLAAVAFLSPFHFQREFKKRLGITPHEYLTACRIRMARKLLSPTANLADIAVAVGFFDQSHFTKVFRKYVGVAPGKFSRQNASP